ncbi:GIY-YIG nuclease family protein [Pedobacter sp. MW01-1-1]|uniref:GIY-YIG nuclease family protein n=1 Tax=Pedobacter sp. MW01-1-1 TaxID=3383027 RepID=UPI003FF0A966
MEFFIYILYSQSSNIYYVGYTNDYERRLEEHNTNERNTFSSKHRPWEICSVYGSSGKVGGNRIISFFCSQY